MHITVCWNGYNHYGLREELHTALDKSVEDYIDECKINVKKRTPFEAVITVPPITPGKSEPIDIFALFWYLPFEDDREQRPPLPTVASGARSFTSSTGTSSSESVPISQEFSNNAIIRCYWQNRLVPWSVVKNLPFMAAADNLRTISPKWRKRIVGILFLDWHFDEIANNKLRFRQNLEEILFQNRDVAYSPASIQDKFAR